TDPHTPLTYTRSLHDALPILRPCRTPEVHIPVPGFQLYVDIERSATAFTGHPIRNVAKAQSGLDPPVIHLAPGPLEIAAVYIPRSEEHTSELQSRVDLVCRLL